MSDVEVVPMDSQKVSAKSINWVSTWAIHSEATRRGRLAETIGGADGEL
jgi:hypothetical protein